MGEGLGGEKDVAQLRAHVEYLSEVIDVLRWTLADVLTSNARWAFAAQLQRHDEAYRATRPTPPGASADE